MVTGRVKIGTEMVLCHTFRRRIMVKKFKIDELKNDSLKLKRNHQHITKRDLIPLHEGAESEHFWKLSPVWIIRGSTHTLTEVIHSSNREHRHGLKSDCIPGYYVYHWPLVIPDNEKMPHDFDMLYHYHFKGCAKGLLLNGKTFNKTDFSRAIEKSECYINELMEFQLSPNTKEMK